MAPHPLATLRFDGCIVPRSAQLGELNGGFKLAMRTLDIFRASVAGAALGMARRALVRSHPACPEAKDVRPDPGGLSAHASQARRDGRADRQRGAAHLPRGLDARRQRTARRTCRRRPHRGRSHGQDVRHREREPRDRHGAADARRPGREGGHQGREPLSRHPVVAHLRRRNGSPATDHWQSRPEESNDPERPDRSLRARPPAAGGSTARSSATTCPNCSCPTS